LYNYDCIKSALIKYKEIFGNVLVKQDFQVPGMYIYVHIDAYVYICKHICIYIYIYMYQYLEIYGNVLVKQDFQVPGIYVYYIQVFMFI
jgi:hypothetical protein